MERTKCPEMSKFMHFCSKTCPTSQNECEFLRLGQKILGNHQR